MGRRTKPTNRELLEGIINIDRKTSMMCSTTQALVRDFIHFMKKENKFQEYLEKKYAATEQDKDPKESK
tara:strand:- start:281 stop:487 length:207 start_codon:yes stop_codon:yes gene_type:complete